MESKQKYIPLSEAAALTPYSAEYLSLLARKKRLRAVRRAGNWLTTAEWVGDYLRSVAGNASSKFQKRESAEPVAPEGFLSVSQAEKKCSYSAAYLSLRIRQGKLQGEKIGRNWYTRMEWLNEYIANHGTVAEQPMASTATAEFNSLITAASLSSTEESAELQLFSIVSHNSVFSSHRLTKLLSASLTITILFTFITTPEALAQAAKVTAANLASTLSAVSRETTALSSQVQDRVLSGFNATTAYLHQGLTSKVHSLDFDINAPRVAGETIERNNPASPAGGQTPDYAVASSGRPSSSLFSRLLAPFKQSFSFLDPSSPSSLISRLSGSAIEIGQSVFQSANSFLARFTSH